MNGDDCLSLWSACTRFRNNEFWASDKCELLIGVYVFEVIAPFRAHPILLLLLLFPHVTLDSIVDA